MFISFYVLVCMYTVMCVLSLCVWCPFNVLSHPYWRCTSYVCVSASVTFLIWIVPCVMPVDDFSSLFIHLLSFLWLLPVITLCVFFVLTPTRVSLVPSRICLYRYFTENASYFNRCPCRRCHRRTWKYKNKTHTHGDMQRRRADREVRDHLWENKLMTF